MRFLNSFALLAGLLVAPLAKAEPRLPHPAPGNFPLMHEMGEAAVSFMHGLHGLDLSEAQEGRIFLLQHEQQPALREYFKAAHKAHEALQALVTSPDFSVDKAMALATAESRAHAQIALLRARVEFETLALLSPEQRKQLEAVLPFPEPKSRGAPAEMPGRPGRKGEPR